MSAEKRDFTDFLNFPGSIVNDVYKFPELTYKDSADRVRSWSITVRLIKPVDDRVTSIDWDLSDEKQLPLTDDLLTVNHLTDAYAEAWVETGIVGGKITRSAPTYFTKVAFEGQANQRSELQQALVYARALYLKKKERGGSESDQKTDRKHNQTQRMFFPMLAKSQKDGEKHLVYPLYIQPKLDGIRCVAFLSVSGKRREVVMYSRTKKIFPSVDYLKAALLPVLKSLYDKKKRESIYLDGELYTHGKRLQDISGESRNAATTALNQYHLYDCFYPSCLDSPFSDRADQLTEIFKVVDQTYIKPVETTLVKSKKEAQALFKSYIKNGYEGVICRNVDGVYLANEKKTGAFMRSPDLVKWKKHFTEEYELVDFTEGKRGKDHGAIIWICKTAGGVLFNVTPKDTTYEERRALYQECVQDFSKFKGCMLTIEFDDKSRDDVPQRAKAQAFRDYE